MTFYLGVVGSAFLAWAGMIYLPYQQVGQLPEYADEDTGLTFPPGESGLAGRGREVYISNGCVYCHTQQVRPTYQGGDIDRGWGARRSVARDYLGQSPALVGYYRIGPDLSNIGAPEEIEVKGVDAEGKETTEMKEVLEKDASWHHRHLYNPRSVYEWSLMPSFSYLYEKRKIVGQSSANALELTGENRPEDGYEIVPSPEAEALVAYLMSLDVRYSLPEAR
ncbi:MAG: cbb3-type cytochrome c oxidase subunit II [Verrucomicrobiota bacterium]